MSENKNNSLAVRSGAQIANVDDVSLDALFNWVVNIATPADLTFDSVRFHEVRDWMKAHKAARELRVKAIRIECIALRKVGVAGYADRLTKPNDRKVASWFAGLTDEQFKTILEESDIATTPFAVMKWVTGEEAEVSKWGSARDAKYQYDEARRIEPYYNFGLTHEVQNVLQEIVMDQDDFTVAEAAEKLWNRLAESSPDKWREPGDLDDNHNFIPPELAGEPLREVVRKVLRAPGAADRVIIGGEPVAVPKFVTFQPSGGDYWKRTPWERAELWQLKCMVELREEQVLMAETVAKNIRGLYECLEQAQVHSETTRVQDLIAYADLEIEAPEAKKPAVAAAGQNINH